jgi:hypothetical protein
VSVSFSRKNLLHEAFIKLTDISQPNYLELTTVSVLVLSKLQVCISLTRLSSQVFITFKCSSTQCDIRMLATCHNDSDTESPMCSLVCTEAVCTEAVFQIMLQRGSKTLSMHLLLQLKP